MTQPIVQVDDVTVGWRRDAVLAEHVSFVVGPGEIFGILGRSACGKSTLLRHLIGLEPALGGHIDIMGEPPRLGVGPPRFGVMFQQGALFGSMSVGENVGLALERWTALPSPAIRAIVRAKLDVVGLAGAEGELPATLSGGMRKRAAIARALALEPTLLFLDEPCSGLDPITSAEIDVLVRTLARSLGLTVVVVTHELGSINSIVDRCILMDRRTRSVLAAGSPSELRESAEPSVRAFFQRHAEAT